MATPDKSLESWIWAAACSIAAAKDAAKSKEFILPLIFTKRLCDVFDDEINRVEGEVGLRAKASKPVRHDKKLVRFFLPREPKKADDAVWSVVRMLSDKIDERLTTNLRTIANADPLLIGLIDRVAPNR
jgi:type I restriction enzyme M protein